MFRRYAHRSAGGAWTTSDSLRVGKSNLLGDEPLCAVTISLHPACGAADFEYAAVADEPSGRGYVHMLESKPSERTVALIDIFILGTDGTVFFISF